MGEDEIEGGAGGGKFGEEVIYLEEGNCRMILCELCISEHDTGKQTRNNFDMEIKKLECLYKILRIQLHSKILTPELIERGNMRSESF